MNPKCDYFKECFDRISLLDDELDRKMISLEQYNHKYSEIEEHYKIGKFMGMEKQWLDWLINNTSPNENEINSYVARIESIKESERELDRVIGKAVISPEHGKGYVIKRQDDIVTVEFADGRKTIAYQWNTAIRSKSLKISSEQDAETFKTPFSEKNHNKTKMDQDVKTRERFSESFSDYLKLLETAYSNQMTGTIYNIVPVIRCDDDSAYTEMLEEINYRAFKSRDTKNILQNAIVNGARRHDSNTTKIFDDIYQCADKIYSIDISSFSVINPIFVEIIQTIKKKMSDSKTIFCFRVDERNTSAVGVIGDKVPAIDISSRQPSAEEYLIKLIDRLPPLSRAPLTSDFKTALKTILQKELYSGSWCGEKSLDYLALKIIKYAAVSQPKNCLKEENLIDCEVLNNLLKDEYDSDDKTTLEKLSEMIGMEDVVDLAEQLVAKEYQDRLLRKKGKTPGKASRNIVFTGPSGCGKTTAARLISHVLQEEGICSGFYECNARALCSEYVGGTKFNTMAAIESAGNGVLFLDEAYSLATSGGKSDYGSEAISVLLTEMENPNSNLTIIFAGYKEEMETFLNSNPGLASRISYSVDFKPYTKDELFEITMSFLEDFKVSPKAKQLIKLHFSGLSDDIIEKPNFGLARYSRNIALKIQTVGAKRHWKSKDGSTEISAEDVRNALRPLSDNKEATILDLNKKMNKKRSARLAK